MEEIELNVDMESVQKKSKKSKVIVAVVCCLLTLGVILGLSFGLNANKRWLTYENYMKIENGMTYTDVVKIFDGHQGECISSSSYGGETMAVYSWSIGLDSVCIIFNNGRVYSKSQYGLR